jgi:hypothetical protein
MILIFMALQAYQGILRGNKTDFRVHPNVRVSYTTKGGGIYPVL